MFHNATQVEAAWCAELIASVQHCVAEVTLTRGFRFVGTLQRHLSPLASPRSVTEGLLLRTVCLDLMLGLTDRLHHWRQPAGRCTCAPAATLARHTGLAGHDPLAACLAWAADYAGELDRAHGFSLEERAATWLDTHYAEPFKIETLARAVGASPRHLRRGFTHALGVAPHVYQGCQRVIAALPLLAGGAKTAGVAMEVGYRSRKNFYRAVGDRLGVDPSWLRVRGGGGDPADVPPCVFVTCTRRASCPARARLAEYGLLAGVAAESFRTPDTGQLARGIGGRMAVVRD